MKDKAKNFSRHLKAKLFGTEVGQASKDKPKKERDRKNDKNKITKETDTKAKFDKVFGLILFAAILLIVFGSVAVSYIPCKTGYNGKIWSCVDTNECEARSHNCSDLSTCINLGKANL